MGAELRFELFPDVSWNTDYELTALPQSVTVGGDTAAVHFNEPLDQGEPYPQAALRRAGGPIELSEQVENARHEVGGNADAVIAHPDLHFRTQLPGGELDLAPPLGVLGGV